MMDPMVSEPMAKGVRPAAVAAPDPLEDPPLHLVLSQGFLQGPVKEAFGCR